YVQFIKGALLVAFCAALTVMILKRGLTTESGPEVWPHARRPDSAGTRVLPETGGWKGKPYARVEDARTGAVTVWRKEGDGKPLALTQTLTVLPGGKTLANGLPQGKGPGQADLVPVGRVAELPGGRARTGPLGPLSFLTTLQDSVVVLWAS